MFLLDVFFAIIFREEKMMNIFSKFKVALLGAILSFGLVASIGTKGVSEASAAGETEPATVTDVITADSLKLTGTTYLSLDKVGVNKSSSALYSGIVARVKISDTEFGIKMSKNKKYGLVTTISGGVLKSVTVEWFKNSSVHVRDRMFSSHRYFLCFFQSRLRMTTRFLTAISMNEFAFWKALPGVFQ